MTRNDRGEALDTGRLDGKNRSDHPHSWACDKRIVARQIKTGTTQMLTASLTSSPIAAVIGGLLERRELAAALNRSERTIVRYERQGMPFIKLGSRRLYEPEKVRNWILGHEQVPLAPRRGRPSGGSRRAA